MSSKLSRATASLSLATCFTDTYQNVIQNMDCCDLIIVDRYIASYYAYDCISALDKDDKSISDLGFNLLNNVLLNKSIMSCIPDYEIFVKVSPLICKERIDVRDEKKYLDYKPIEHFIKSYQAYMDYYMNFVPGFITIENEGTLEDLKNRVSETLLTLKL